MKNIALALSVLAILGCNKNNAVATASKSAEKTIEPSTSPHQPVATYDGPFGLAMGISVAELERMGFKPVDTVPGAFIGAPPRPLDNSGAFIVLAAPKSGVCRIRASVRVPVVNGSGDQIKAEVDRLAESMEVKYGKFSKKVDYIGEDVYRRNPQFWMMGLKESSVAYGYLWTAGKTTSSLPSRIAQIEISADTQALNDGSADIQYTFENNSDCQKEFKAMKAANL